jgi:hypothetical protein
MAFWRVSVVFVFPALAFACGGADQSPLLGGDGGGPPPVDAGGQDVAMQQDTGAMDVVSVKDVVTVDVPVGPPDSKIQCGPSLTCSAQNEVCCHHTASITAWECVTDVSACNNAGDVPIGCSSHDNCTSQGEPSYICCADVQQGTMCVVATDVSCMATCDSSMDQIQVGCSTTDACLDPTTPTCKSSTCTLPGYNICE